MSTINLEMLLGACSPGGPSCLSVRTELAPAAGPEAAVAPAKFVRGSQSCYAYERRFINGIPQDTVLIDSKQSQLNRAEAALVQAIRDHHAVITRIPRIEIVYERDGVEERYSDLELPHRAFDGHIRAGSIDGTPTTQHPAYRALRDATPLNARALLETSPATLNFGGWDSTRRSHQGRWRSVLSGEIIGVCASTEEPKRGGARVDPVGMQVLLGAKDMEMLLDAMGGELSPKLVAQVKKDIEKAKGAPISASRFGLGGIPPSLEALGGVACSRIVRAHVLSFATLRQIRFGEITPEATVAARAVLAAIAINGLARSNAELYLRANCDLVETSPISAIVDRRNGKDEPVNFPDIPAADALLAEAIGLAEQAMELDFHGLALEVKGDPAIVIGVLDTDDGVES